MEIFSVQGKRLTMLTRSTRDSLVALDSGSFYPPSFLFPSISLDRLVRSLIYLYQQGSLVIKLGEAFIPYHEDFKFYITTKLPNPHYTPEISTKVTLVNFTLSPSGLEDQVSLLVS